MAGAIVGIAGMGLQYYQEATAKREAKDYAYNTADLYDQAGQQSLIDAQAAAHRRELKGEIEQATVRSLLAKGGADASSGSAMAVSGESAANIAWEAAMLRHLGSVAFWDNKYKARAIKHGASAVGGVTTFASLAGRLSGIGQGLEQAYNQYGNQIGTALQNSFEWLTTWGGEAGGGSGGSGGGSGGSGYEGVSPDFTYGGGTGTSYYD